MKIETAFGIGDRIWVTRSYYACECATVGQVRVEVTDSPGMSEDTIFDNYKPQKERVEQYMCVETGIGSGNIYTLGIHAFATEEEALAQIKKLADERAAETPTHSIRQN